MLNTICIWLFASFAPNAASSSPGVRRMETVHLNSFTEVSAAGATVVNSDVEANKSDIVGEVGVRRMAQKVRSNSDAANADSSGRINEHHPVTTKAGLVMYGLVTNQLPRYRKKLETVMDTWASRARLEGRFFAIAGRGYPSKWLENGVVIASNCDDTGSGNACKEASLILEGKRRGASWLVIAGEDNYVDTYLLDPVLQAENSSVPVGLGCLGCGKGLKQYGEQVATHGGFCGGCGEAISGAALERLGSNGAALVEEYGTEKQCDMSTSAALLNRGIPLRKFPGESSKKFHGMRYDAKDRLDLYVRTGLSFHYVTSDVMRYIHGSKTGASEKEMNILEDAAFKDGCVRGFPCDAHQFSKRLKGAVLFERLAASLGR